MTIKRLGFWLDVYKEAGRIITRSPGIGGEIAFNLALDTIETRDGYPPLVPALVRMLPISQHASE